ncbi:uncharacterized protein K02A2.6-like [Sitodiplosis mosellana]|uniref:uncharacterized protein K02A2.6-like n=1 Tax=Sitodiplosis mosellana TaxID=263140 RepID=UPI0024447DCC|nr:uncharacterized protein K02A2.6-like [Sitodiplosis mosellana]
MTDTKIITASSMPEFNPTENWNLWFERLELHFVEIECTDEKQKISILLKLIGAEAYQILHCLCSPKLPSKEKYNDLCALMKAHYTPPVIVFNERRNFYAAKMGADERVASWFARVKRLSLDCKFVAGDLERIVLDKFVVELPSKIFEKLCEEDETLTLQTALKKAMMKETKIQQSQNSSVDVNFIKARGKQQKRQQQQQSQEELRIEPCDVTNYDYPIYSIEGSEENDRYELTVLVDGVRLTVECDTGAPCSLISIHTFDKYFDRRVLKPCNTPFSGYTGDPLKIIGEFQTVVNYKGQKISGIIVVTNSDRPTLLGRNFLRAFSFELVQTNRVNNIFAPNEMIDSIKSEFHEVFSCGLGKYNVTTIKLPIQKDVTPIFCKPRPVPLAWRDMIAKQLDDFVSKGILIPVDNSDWATPLVPLLKPSGDIRICGDYKVTINRFLIDFKYPLPRIDQIFASMQGGILFTKLDMSNAYNQLVLDDEAQKLCTWSTHKGIFKMTRLPFGVKIAAALFQKTMENLLSCFSNVFCYQDDIVVTGPTLADHLKTIKQVLIKLQTAGLRLNVNKCEFFKEKISYLGFDIDKNGSSPFSIQYIKGSLNTADSLSRIAQVSTAEETKESSYINYVGSNIMKTLTYKDIATHTRRDLILSKVHDCIQHGTVDQLQGSEYTSFRNKATELSVESGCILWGYRTVIPNALRKIILQDLHASHMGIVKTKALARSYVYWPHIDKEIENLIKGCVYCQKTQASPEKSTLMPWTPTDSAWKRVHIDFAASWFKTMEDNLHRIYNIYTAPGHPSTNGQAENFVKTLKKSLIATIEESKIGDFDTILDRFLFDYRITKHCTTNETPAKLLLGKELKSRFSWLKPPVVTDVIKEKQQTAIKNYKGNRNVNFSVGQKVYVRDYRNPNKASWSQATIKNKIGPRNYTCLLLREKRDIKRHVDQIRDGETDDMGGDELPLELNDSQGSEQAHDAATNEIDLPSDTAGDSSDLSFVSSHSQEENELEESIPDVIERPATRRVAAQAKQNIKDFYTSNRRR